MTCVAKSSLLQLLRLVWVHRLQLGKVRNLWIQRHVRSGNIRVSKMSGLENPSDAPTKYCGPEPLLGQSKACEWVLVGGRTLSLTVFKSTAESSDKDKTYLSDGDKV